MKVTASGFDWDAGNRSHCRKHGVSEQEIEDVLRGDPRIAPDLKHSDAEKRFLAIGRTSEGRAAFVVFTFRGDLIRALSARYMHADEVERYGRQSS